LIRRSTEVYVGNVSPDAVVKLLSDRDFVVENMPYVTGVEGDRVKLRFRRMLFFSFEDVYSVATGFEEGTARCFFRGSASEFTMEFAPVKRFVRATVLYRGPRGWVVASCLERAARDLIKSAIEDASKATSGVLGVEDYSQRLALVSWVSSLLMRSVLVKSELTVVPRGGLVDIVEKLVSEGVMDRYRVVYVSGTSERGSFRLLFVDGKLVGIYANLGGKEFVGDERVLNEFEGFTRVKVYGSNAPELPR